MLAGLASAYIAAINAGAVPTIATAWQVGIGGHVPFDSLNHSGLTSCHAPLPPQGVADAECRRAAAAAEETYRRAFDAEGVAPEPELLLAEHQVFENS
jgi:hypothetical protein